MKRLAVWLLLAGAVLAAHHGHAQTVGVLPTEATAPVASGSCLLVDQLTTMTASIASTTMNVTGIASGNFAIGDNVLGAAAGTKITAFGTGTGGTGNYTIAPSQTVASSTLTARGDRKLCSNYATALGGMTTPAQTVWGNFASSSANEAPNPVPSAPDTGGQRLNFVADTGLITGTSVGGGDREMGVPPAPTGTTSTTPVMLGLSTGVGPQPTFITPTRNGRYLVWARGWVSGTPPATLRIVVGTGSAPANGAAVPAGSLVVGNTQAIVPTSGSARTPYQCTALVTGLTPATRYWVDLQVASPTAVVNTVTSTNIVAIEN